MIWAMVVMVATRGALERSVMRLKIVDKTKIANIEITKVPISSEDITIMVGIRNPMMTWSGISSRLRPSKMVEMAFLVNFFPSFFVVFSSSFSIFWSF